MNSEVNGNYTLYQNRYVKSNRTPLTETKPNFIEIKFVRKLPLRYERG